MPKQVQDFRITRTGDTKAPFKNVEVYDEAISRDFKTAMIPLMVQHHVC